MTTIETEASRRTFSDWYEALAGNVGAVVHGKDDVVELALVCVFAQGHLLVEDVPGVGKTTLAKALARSIDGSFGRIQFTPDLLPSDVVGVSVWNRGTGDFVFRPGPVFSNVVVADEVNRASPKTQSALLEAMAERQVTVDGTTHQLGRPFVLLATENPIEHEGTYPLPDSQLDRFCMRLSMGYPARQAEIELLASHTDVDPLDAIGPVITTGQMTVLCDAVGRVEVAGTGDGQLWVFTPALGSTTGTPVLARLDRNTAQTLEEYDVSGITSVGGFAIKFFGGSFYIFVGEDVWQVDRASLVPGQAQPTTPPQLVFSNPGRDVVGAGVSTCAPVQ